MMEGFWRRDFSVANYSQIYSTLACWQARLGQEKPSFDVTFTVKNTKVSCMSEKLQ